MRRLTDFLKKTLLAVGIIVLGIMGIIGTVSLAAGDDEKKNEGSYWDTSNAPLIYGATAITIPEGTVSSFQVKDARFRTFAKDFEDGDLTTKLQVSGEEDVDVNKVGTYYLTYSVTDSHGNETTLKVPVTVTEPTEDSKIKVERTLYTLPSDWNMRLAGFTRCNTGDRQILGIYMPAGTSARIRSLDADVNFTVQFITNDTHTEISQTVKSDGEWVELKNTKDDTDYDSVPLITSVMQGPTNQPSPLDQINKTYKVELEYDTSVKELDYYHYQDDEAAFRSRWKEDGNTYGVIENEVLTMVVPLTDESKMTNYYRNGFETLDQHLEYYQKAIEKMDTYVGLEFNPENLTDQNIRTKYLIRANVNGYGSAYYIGNHVGIHSASMASFFEMNWGGLHELAHGYQGYLGKGEMNLGEVANNILGYYIQSDKDIYFHAGSWLGELANVEESNNAKRLAGEDWSAEESGNMLYMIVNLLNNGRSMTNQDAYVESLADIYGVNVIPYMEAWGLTISDDLQDEIYARNLPMVSILKDMVSDESLTDIMAGENLTEKYSIVDNTIYKKYGVTGNATIQVDIDNQELVQGKMIQVQEDGKLIRSVRIEAGTATITDLPVGTYYLQMPIVNGYTQGHMYLQVTEGENNCTYTYTSTGDVDYNNYLSLKLQGIYGTFGYVLTFKENYTKASITLGGANMGNGSNPYVKIYDDNGTLVSDEEIVSEGIYFDFNKGTYELDIKPGYVIEVYHPNQARVQVYSTISGEALSAYNPVSSTTKYIVTESGVRTESMSDEEQQELMYKLLKEHMYDIISAYAETATEEELNNKYTNFRKKAEIISAYNQLKAEEQELYKELLTKIQQGGTPVLTASDTLSFEKGAEINLYTLVSATDNEDGVITLDSSNTTLSSELNVNVPGIHSVTYRVKDSDGNISEITIGIEIIGEKNEDKEDTDKDVPDTGKGPVTGEEGGGLPAKENVTDTTQSTTQKPDSSSSYASLSTTEDIQNVVLSDGADNRSQYVSLSESTEKAGTAATTESTAKTETASGTETVSSGTEAETKADTGETQKIQGETVSESAVAEEKTKKDLSDAQIADESEEQENEDTGYIFLAILVIILCICVLAFLLLYVVRRKMKK
jgi:hypothetical protein